MIDQIKMIVLLDVDGVIVPNILEEPNTSNLKEEEFAKMVMKYTEANPNIIHFLRMIKALGKCKIFIFTGRKEHLLGEFTKKLLANAGIIDLIDGYIFYPRPNGYTKEEYYGWKKQVISDQTKIDKVLIVDDDKKLLSHLRESMVPQILKKLTLFQYCIHADNKQESAIY